MTDNGSSPDTERASFIKAMKHLDCVEMPDAWGRPMFQHTHVEAMWSGWKARASQPATPTAGELCTDGPPAEHKRQWVLIFSDTEKGIAVFDDEKEAHTMWDRAKDNWTCTLFETSVRKYEWRAGELRPFTATASDAVAGEAKAFYGAQCPDYPACKGGCGLGCTHEIEQARAQAATTREDEIKDYWHKRMDQAQERIQGLESALMMFFRVLRGESSFVQNSYELHVSKEDYGKARDIYDRRTPDAAQPTPSREQIAAIIDPTAWIIDNDGYCIEQQHGGESLEKADAILALTSTEGK